MPKADVFSMGVVMVECSSRESPCPGPTMRKMGRLRVAVPEEERRAADIAAARARNPEIAELALHCIVDFVEDRADAASVLALCEAQLARAESSVSEQPVQPSVSLRVHVHHDPRMRGQSGLSFAVELSNIASQMTIGGLKHVVMRGTDGERIVADIRGVVLKDSEARDETLARLAHVYELEFAGRRLDDVLTVGDYNLIDKTKLHT